MRILHVVHGWFPRHRGGTERYVARLLEEQRAMGHDVALVTGSERESSDVCIQKTRWMQIPVFQIRRSGLYLESWHRAWNPAVELLFEQILREWRPELVHVHHWQRLTRTLVEVCSRAGIPRVLTLHDSSSSCPKAFRIREGSFCERKVSPGNCGDCVPGFFFQGRPEIDEAIEAHVADMARELELADAVLAPSRALADLIEAHHPAIAGRIRVLPHGRISAADFVPAEDAEASAGLDVLRLGYWGAIQPMKGVGLLIDAIAASRQKERLRLFIRGAAAQEDAEFESDLRRRAAGLPIEFLGGYHPDDIPAGAVDLAVFPSIAFESWSFTVDEAFERGIPVVVPDRGAPRERGGAAAFAFRAEDPQDLARVIDAIVDDPVGLDAARRAVPVLEDMDRHAVALDRIYAEVRKRGGARDDRSLEWALRRAARLARRIEARDRLIWELEGKVEQEQDRARGLEGEVQVREQGLDKRDEVLAGFVQSLSELSALVKKRDEELGRLSEEYQSVRAELEGRLLQRDEAIRRRDADLEEFVRSTEAFQVEVERNRREAEEARDRVRSLEKELNASRVAADRARGEAARQLEAKVREHAAAVQKLEGAIRADVELLESTLAEVEALRRDDVANLDAARREAVAALDAARTEAAEERARAETQVRSGREREESLRRDLERGAASLQEAARESEALRRDHAKLESERDRLALMRANLHAEAGRLETALALRQSALREAITELTALRGRMEEIEERCAETLTPIAVEAGRIAGAGFEEILQGTLANHHRLHDVIRDRDRLLDHLVRRVDELEGAGMASPAPTASDGASQAARRLLGLQRRISNWRRSARRGGSSGDRMRILYVIHDYLPKHAAGTEIYAHHLAKGMARDHEVRLLFCEARHELPRYTVSRGEYDGLPYTEVVHNYKWENFEETYHDPKMEAIFAAELEEFRPDVVHVQHLHYFSMNFVPMAKAHGAMVVYTLHEFMLLCARGGQLLREDMEICERPVPEKCADCIRHWPLAGNYGQDPASQARERLRGSLSENLKKAFLSWAGPGPGAALNDEQRAVYARAAATRLDFVRERAAAADLFISPSAFLRQRFIDCGMIAPERIIHSDNGFDLSPFAGVPRVPSDRLRFGFVGTIAEYKGVHLLVEAMNGITEEDVELQIWGDLETFVEYKERLVPLARNPRIRFMGRFQNARIAEVLAGIDVLIVPSLWFENSPLTIHEAWLARIPVIASDRGGMAELVADGRNGLLFRLGDADDLRAKMKVFIGDRALAGRLAAEVGAVKPIAANVVEIEAIYRDLVARKRR